MTSPTRRSQVVRRLPNSPQPSGGVSLVGVMAALLMLGAVCGGGFYWTLQAQPAAAPVVVASASPVRVVPLAATATAPSPVFTPDVVASVAPLLPTVALLPTPTPLAGTTGAQWWDYVTQPGDTLAALAARFGVNPDDQAFPAAWSGYTTLPPGETVQVPRVLDSVGPDTRLVPDSEVVFSSAATGFDPQAFVMSQGGYLSRYRGFMDGLTLPGAQVVLRMADRHSINPRLMLALLDYHSGWVTNPNPQGDDLKYPFGFVHPYRHELGTQANWAALQLERGYYGWRSGTLTTLTFPNGQTLRLNPTLNAGTVAVQFLFAQIYNYEDWLVAVSDTGWVQTYQRLFGNPFDRAVRELIPADLRQPDWSFPFLPGQIWYYSGGPHGVWDRGGAQAALDFAPSSVLTGCAESEAWVTAMAAGLVVRAERGIVSLDTDGDGRESTGWVIFYLHIAERNRVRAGTYVERGDRLGHPSCEGGNATGTHIHLARKFNGEWILADSAVPFTLDGWVARNGSAEYEGALVRNGETIRACPCTAAWTAVRRDP